MARVITCDLCHDEEATAMWSSLTDGSTIAAGDNCAPMFIMGLAQAVGIWPDEPVSGGPVDTVPAEPKPKQTRKMTAREREIYLEGKAGDEVDGTVQSGGHGGSPGRADDAGRSDPTGSTGTATEARERDAQHDR